MTENAIQPQTTKTRCKNCFAKDVPMSAEICPHCKCPMKIEPCKFCGKGMPKGAKYCNECKSFHGWRRLLTVSAPVLALLTALVSVTPAALKAGADYFHRNSNTSVLVEDVDYRRVYVRLTNTGLSPATFDHAQLIFGENISLVDADLFPEDIGNLVIPPDAFVRLKLRLRDRLHLKPNTTEAGVLKQIETYNPTLRCYVNESNKPNCPLDPTALPPDSTRVLIKEGMR